MKFSTSSLRLSVVFSIFLFSNKIVAQIGLIPDRANNSQKIEVTISEKGSLTGLCNLGNFKGSKGEIYPLLINFGTEPERGVGRLVPGCRIPFLESYATKLSEDKIKIVSSSDESYILKREETKLGLYSSELITASVDGKGLMVTSKDGSRLEFEAGRILKYQFQDIEFVKWNYDNGTLKSIDMNKIDRLDVRQGLDSLSISQNNKHAQVTWEYVDDKKSISLPIIKKLSTLNGDTLFFENSLRDGVISTVVTNQNGKQMASYSYNIDGGEVKSLGNSICRVENCKGFDSPKISLITNGKTTIFQNPKSKDYMRNKELLPDGTIIERVEMLTSGGPRLRKITNQLPGEIDSNEKYRAFYDDKGKLFRDVSGDYERSFENGKFVVKKKGIIVRTY